MLLANAQLIELFLKVFAYASVLVAPLLHSIKLESLQGHENNSLRVAWAMHVSSALQKNVLWRRLIRLTLDMLSLSLSTSKRALSCVWTRHADK